MERRPLGIMLAAHLALAAQGCLYMNVRVPLDKNVSVTRLGPKVGKSNAHSVIWLIAWGDAGTKAAAVDGKMTRIDHLDTQFKMYLFGLYTRRTTIAYGE